MKKLTSLVLVLVLLCAALPAAQAVVSLNQYASAKFDAKNIPVYSGPGEDYYRANNGKAAYGGAGTSRIYGVVGNWIMIGYGMANGGYRIGYISADYLKVIYGIKGDINYNLTFDNTLMRTIEPSPINDDPIVGADAIDTIPTNTVVTRLGMMEQWAYVEWHNGSQKMRGFVREDHLTYVNSGDVPTTPVYPVITPMPTPRPIPTPMPTQAPVYSGNSMLSSLKHNCPNTGVMLPEYFSPYQDTYLLTVADWVSRVTFTPTAYDPNATITVNGQTVRSGNASQIINMTDKPQAVTIKVQSGYSTTTYTVYLQRRPSEKRTRVSAGYVSNIYSKNNEWRLVADLGTINYLSTDYTTGSRSTFENKTADRYDYVVSPNCLFYYGTAANPIRVNTINEFMAYYRIYGSTLYTIVYIEDEIVAVFPYSPDGGYYYQ